VKVRIIHAGKIRKKECDVVSLRNADTTLFWWRKYWLSCSDNWAAACQYLWRSIQPYQCFINTRPLPSRKERDHWTLWSPDMQHSTWQILAPTKPSVMCSVLMTTPKNLTTPSWTKQEVYFWPPELSLIRGCCISCWS